MEKKKRGCLAVCAILLALVLLTRYVEERRELPTDTGSTTGTYHEDAATTDSTTTDQEKDETTTAKSTISKKKTTTTKKKTTTTKKKTTTKVTTKKDTTTQKPTTTKKVTTKKTTKQVPTTAKTTVATTKKTTTTTKPTVTTTKKNTKTTVTTTAAPKPQTNLFAGYALPAHRTMYTKLSAEEKSIYRELRQAVIHDTDTFVLKNVTYDTTIPLLERAAHAVYADFPEFFWMAYSTQHQKLSSGSVGDLKVTVWFNTYWHDVTNRTQRVQTVMNRAKQIADDACSRYTTAFDRIRYIHDFLTTNVEYDHEAAENMGSPNQTEANMTAFSAYGALVNQKAVCEGYAHTFKLLLNQCGYDCEYVFGTANGGPHAWNYVTVDGKSYWVDVTWNDFDLPENPAIRTYAYFCVTSDRFLQDHTPSEKFFAMPSCTATDMDFYYYTGSHLSAYSLEGVRAALRAQYPCVCINLRFDTYDGLQAAVNNLFGANQHQTKLGLVNQHIVKRYAVKRSNTLTLVLE